jgi:hypothetical protein
MQKNKWKGNSLIRFDDYAPVIIALLFVSAVYRTVSVFFYLFTAVARIAVEFDFRIIISFQKSLFLFFL